MNYGFQCSRCHCRYFLDPLRQFPSCPTCLLTLSVQDHQWAAREGSTIADTFITPQLARSWLPLNGTVEGPNNPRRVAELVQIMASGRWVDMTLDRGGILMPIVFDEAGRIRYGNQRLEACIIADTPFTAVVVRWPALES